jgi:hypothetical protein
MTEAVNESVNESIEEWNQLQEKRSKELKAVISEVIK